MIFMALAAAVALADLAPVASHAPAAIPPACVTGTKLAVDDRCLVAIQELEPGEALTQARALLSRMAATVYQVSKIERDMDAESGASKKHEKELDKYLHAITEKAKDETDAPFLHGDVVTGTVFAGSSSSNPFSHAIQPTYVRWTSLPFRVVNRAKDRHQWRIFGRFGLTPITTFIEPTEPELRSGTSKPSATDAKGFSWNAGLRYDALVGRHTNLGLHIAGGQGILLSKSEQIDGPDGKPVSAAVAGRVFDTVTEDYEVGATIAVFTAPPVDRLLGLSPDPVASLVVGYRHDGRFVPNHGVLGFRSPEHRLFARFAVDLPLVTGPETPGKGKAEKFSVRFAVEHERSCREGPKVTRILLGGSLNVFDELLGKKKDANAGAGPSQ